MADDDNLRPPTESSYLEVSCSRPVVDELYGQGSMEFPFSVSAPSVFYPDKSYLKVELELYGPGDSASRNAPT